MMMFLRLLFYWTLHVLTITCVGYQVHYDASIISLEQKPCNHEAAFRLYFKLPFKDCVDECHLRARCHSVMYHHVTGMCGLMNTVDADTPGDSEDSKPLCVFADVRDWERTHLGPCSVNACNTTERCTVNENNNGMKCVSSECLNPPEIPNAKFISQTLVVGEKNAYLCDAAYIPEGDLSITCLRNATWSLSNFVCLRSCPYPLKVKNAKVLTRGRDFKNGTTVTFECKDGYYSLTGGYVHSVCEGQCWSPRMLPCCKLGYNLTKGVCHGKVHMYTSWKSMHNTCQDIKEIVMRLHLKSWLHDMNHSARFEILKDALQANDAIDVIMIGNRKTELEQTWTKTDLFECITANTSMSYSFSGDSYEALLHVIRNNAGVMGNCKIYLHAWDENEPNGGRSENCLIIKKPDYKLQDVLCDGLQNLKVGFICHQNDAIQP